jgi:8-amino-7-oxononanoate synthase
MKIHLEQILANKLAQRASENSLRKLQVKDNLIDFSSNDYLGLSRNKELLEHIEKDFQTEIKKNKHLIGATGSRLLTGNSGYAESLEKYIANLFFAESALLFNNGYMANMAVLSSIPQKDDTILYDELSHSCIKDGARLSIANRFSFKHNDLTDLENKIKKAKGNVFVVTESVFSMDGDMAPLPLLFELTKKYNAYLIVDEAHSTGLFGENGSGLSNELGIKPFIIINTFGKAVGTHGAVVICSKTVKDFLVNYARTFIYTTALPLHTLVSIKNCLSFMAANKQLVTDLKQNIQHYIKVFKLKDYFETPIQYVLILGNENVKKTSLLLEQNGLDVRPILSPTVKEGTERLRICLHNFNTKPEIDLIYHSISSI